MKYISLKEAAEISGYAPDYIGQLIRKGKLPGKQVYSNVAWVTTEDALRSYMEGKQASGSASGETGDAEPDSGDYRYLKLERRYQKLAKASLYGIVIVLVLFAAVLFYALSVRLDSKIQQRAALKLENSQQK
jgi:hypothetical protein